MSKNPAPLRRGCSGSLSKPPGREFRAPPRPRSSPWLDCCSHSEPGSPRPPPRPAESPGALCYRRASLMDDPREPDADEERRALERLLGLRAGRAPTNGSRAAPSAPAAAPAAPRFELLEALGRGPHGESFRAADREQQGRSLRLKRLFSEPSARVGLLERLEELGQRQRPLEAHGLVRLRGVGRGADGRLELESAWIDGASLRALLAERGTLAPRHALEIARQILLVLERAHARGLVHGRLVAENVLLERRAPWTAENPFGVGVRLSDQGLVRLLGAREPSAAEDIATLGELLCAMLTGAPGAAHGAALQSALGTAELARLVARARGEEPGFQDAARLRGALERSAAWRGRRAPALALWAGGIALLSLALAGLRPSHAAELERLRAELVAARGEAQAVRACTVLERFLARIEEGDRPAAADVLAAARASAGLGPLGFECGYLEALLALATTLAQADAARDDLRRAELLLAARAHERTAAGTKERFGLAAAPWLELAREPRPARARDLERWRTTLGREFAQRSTALSAQLEARWSALLAQPAVHADEVCLLARWFDDGRGARLADALTREPAGAASALARALRAEPGTEGGR
ncbi:MAG: hypothetical protein EXS08_15770 [Planctomycetes bacterium]|nr:hypothetical protein [Planctomycetota bacterium]